MTTPFVMPATERDDPLRFDEQAFERLMSVYHALRFWVDPVVIGIEHIPAQGRAIVASNHGQFGIEGAFLAEAIHSATGRRGRPLSDRVFFMMPALGAVLATYGIVEGSPGNARRLLEAEHLVMTMPGGAREALVGEEDRYKLFWPRSAGVARTAMETGAAIIPVASIGACDFYRMPVSAETNRRSPLGWLVRALLDDDRYVPPMYAGLGAFPLPQQLWFIIGEPLQVERDPVGAADDEAVAEVTSRARAALEKLIARGLALRDEQEKALTSAPRSWLNRVLRTLRAPVDVPGYRDDSD